MGTKIKFAGLHNHTHYSFLDSTNKPKDLFTLAKELEYDALAITDHGNMCGVVDCWKTAQKIGIKFIPGLEAYFCEDIARKEQKRYHLTLLAINDQGYHNLCKLSTLSYLRGYYYKPRIDFQLLDEYSEGIVALSGCLGGMIPQFFLNGDDPAKIAERFKDILGDRFFIEVWDHKIPEERRVLPKLVKLGKELGIELVATQDTHYLYQTDHLVHAHLLAIGRRTTPENAQYQTDHFYLKTKEEMAALFTHIPEAVENTVKISSMVDWNLDLSTKHAPKFTSGLDKDNITLFRENVLEGFKARYPEAGKDPKILERLKYEVRVIEKLGFVDYFLILQDLHRFTRKEGIPTGPGRGSACGSIVSYSLGITDVDPMRFGLLFERFLNEDRVSDPDIDMDFCKVRRPEVIHYLERKYGKENVAKIGTFSHLHAKSSLRDVGRVRGLSYVHQNALAKRVPDGDPEWDIKKLTKSAKDIAGEIHKFGEYIEIADKLKGVIRHRGIHAAGIIVGDQPLRELIPLYSTPQDPRSEISQFSMNDVESVGLLKIDILGLETLTVIHNCLHFIPEDRRPILNAKDLEDEKTFELLRRGETVGVFQLESFGMRQILLMIQPRVIEHIIDTISIYRPGPLDSGMVEHYIRRARGEEKVTYLHPSLSEILAPTYGILIYQEQIMQTVVKLCGYSLSQADELRRVIGKKKIDLIPKEREKFVKAFQKHTGEDEEQAKVIWSHIETFGKYGFNKPHATSYAIISYWTAYLKTHFPKEFMASLLTSEMGNKEKLQKYIFEATQRMKIPVFLPDINRSMYGFVPEDKGIRAGLGCIDGIAESSAKAIIQARGDKPFANLTSLISRIKKNRGKLTSKVLTNLILSGALDSIIPNRKSAIEGFPEILSEKVTEAVSLFDEDEIQDIVQVEEFSNYEKREKQEAMLGMYTLEIKE